MKTRQTPYGTATIISLTGNFPTMVQKTIGGIFGDIYLDGKFVYGFNGYECYRFPQKQFKRAIQLLTETFEPRYIRCYDNGGETADRYTIVFTGNYSKGTGYDKRFQYVGMGSAPYHPQGICYNEDSEDLIDKPSYKHLGKKIKFSDLPADCRQIVFSNYADLWDFSGISL